MNHDSIQVQGTKVFLLELRHRFARLTQLGGVQLNLPRWALMPIPPFTLPGLKTMNGNQRVSPDNEPRCRVASCHVTSATHATLSLPGWSGQQHLGQEQRNFRYPLLSGPFSLH
jgi:hypothetical protein